MVGTVKWFDAKKGFGFIIVEDGTEVFVHQSNINMRGFRCLNEGDIVSLEVEEDISGKKKAVNVTTILAVKGIKRLLLLENHYLRIAKNEHKEIRYIVVDESNEMQTEEMTLAEVATYVGLNVDDCVYRMSDKNV